MQDVLLVLAEVPLFNARSSDAFLRARAETLAYTYSSGTNKLSKVTVGGVQKSYAYNADGTMKTDGLRGLTVTYNPLKLPNKIKVSSNTGTVDYIYDANGNKLVVKQSGTMKSVYCCIFVYNTSLAENTS